MSDYEPPPDLEIIVLDSLTLRMSALDKLAAKYPAMIGAHRVAR